MPSKNAEIMIKAPHFVHLGTCVLSSIRIMVIAIISPVKWTQYLQYGTY